MTCAHEPRIPHGPDSVLGECQEKNSGCPAIRGTLNTRSVCQCLQDLVVKTGGRLDRRGHHGRIETTFRKGSLW
jgi:hypothetical protein